jgi:hypothetical protein
LNERESLILQDNLVRKSHHQNIILNCQTLLSRTQHLWSRVQVFGTKKRNTKKESLNLRVIASPDYNEQLDDEEKEEVAGEEVKADYQYPIRQEMKTL